jgi:diketogulonate reductase-like aldo/keto reductase
MADSDDIVYRQIAATKASYVNLGKSGLRVSNPIFGCMSFGHKDWQDWVIEEEEALPLLKYAYDKGLNTWDTANVYSNGVSEEIIAKAIQKYDIPRHKLVIMSKIYAYIGEEVSTRGIVYGEKIAESKEYVNQGGLSRGAIFKAVDASLKRLNTDYMDLLQIHRFDPYTPMEETMEALHDLVKSGKVRYIGASSMVCIVYDQKLSEINKLTGPSGPTNSRCSNSSLRRGVGPSSSVCRSKSALNRVRAISVATQHMLTELSLSQPLQSPLPRRRARDESLLQRDGCRPDSLVPTRPRTSRPSSPGLRFHNPFERRKGHSHVRYWHQSGRSRNYQASTGARREERLEDVPRLAGLDQQESR